MKLLQSSLHCLIIRRIQSFLMVGQALLRDMILDLSNGHFLGLSASAERRNSLQHRFHKGGCVLACKLTHSSYAWTRPGHSVVMRMFVMMLPRTCQRQFFHTWVAYQQTGGFANQVIAARKLQSESTHVAFDPVAPVDQSFHFRIRPNLGTKRMFKHSHASSIYLIFKQVTTETNIQSALLSQPECFNRWHLTRIPVPPSSFMGARRAQHKQIRRLVFQLLANSLTIGTSTKVKTIHQIIRPSFKTFIPSCLSESWGTEHFGNQQSFAFDKSSCRNARPANLGWSQIWLNKLKKKAATSHGPKTDSDYPVVPRAPGVLAPLVVLSARTCHAAGRGLRYQPLRYKCSLITPVKNSEKHHAFVEAKHVIRTVQPENLPHAWHQQEYSASLLCVQERIADNRRL